MVELIKVAFWQNAAFETIGVNCLIAWLHGFADVSIWEYFDGAYILMFPIVAWIKIHYKFEYQASKKRDAIKKIMMKRIQNSIHIDNWNASNKQAYPYKQLEWFQQ